MVQLSLVFTIQLSSSLIYNERKNHSFDYTDLCQQSNGSFLPRSKYLLILCLQSQSTVILELKKIKSVTVSTFPVLNQSIVSCPVLTVASWHECRFLRRQVRWFGIPLSSRIFHSSLWSTQSKALTQSIK